MHTLEDFYQYLLRHDLVDKVLEYHKLYPYTQDDYMCQCNPLWNLFEWAVTPENSQFWSDLCCEYEMCLEPTSIQDVVKYLRTRHTQQETPYEFWYCSNFYAFLLEHGIYERVVDYHIYHPYLPDDRKSNTGPINDLFEWSKTAEGHTWWSNLNQKLPQYFKTSDAPTVGEIFDYLRQAHTPRPYEFW